MVLKKHWKYLLGLTQVITKINLQNFNRTTIVYPFNINTPTQVMTNNKN